MQSLRIQLQKRLSTFDNLNDMEYARFLAIKFEAARIHLFYLIDIFIAVAVVVA